MTDLISVIMPCYNMERFVERSIASLQAQTYPHWELLVVDDGSEPGNFIPSGCGRLSDQAGFPRKERRNRQRQKYRS